MNRTVSAFYVASLAIVFVGLTVVSVSAEPTVLFADTFDRADNDDLNAVATGKSGTLGALDWLEKAATGGGRIVTNELQLGEVSAGGGWALAYLDHNFVDAGILSAGGFSVSIDITDYYSRGATRNAGFVVGGAATTFSGWSSGLPDASDFGVGLDPTGTTQLRVYTNGIVASLIAVTQNAPDTLRVDFTGITNFTSGSSVSYEIFLEGSSITSGTFTWSGTDENYLGLFSNWTDSGAELDNFEISADIKKGMVIVVR